MKLYKESGQACHARGTIIAALAMKEPPDCVTSDEPPHRMSDDGKSLEMRLTCQKLTELILAPLQSAMWMPY